MRRYFAAGALLIAAGLGAFFAIGGPGGAAAGPVVGRIQRPGRYGGRAWPAAASSCVAATGAALIDGDWADLQNEGVAARTLNAGADPGCGTAMERFVFHSTTAAGYSAVDNIGFCPDPVITGFVSYGCYVQGTSGSGTTDIGTFDGSWHTNPIAYTTATTWFHFNAQLSGNTGNKHFAIGNLSVVNGGTARSTSDVKVWGCRCIDALTISQ